MDSGLDGGAVEVDGGRARWGVRCGAGEAEDVVGKRAGVGDVVDVEALQVGIGHGCDRGRGDNVLG